MGKVGKYEIYRYEVQTVTHTYIICNTAVMKRQWDSVEDVSTLMSTPFPCLLFRTENTKTGWPFCLARYISFVRAFDFSLEPAITATIFWHPQIYTYIYTYICNTTPSCGETTLEFSRRSFHSVNIFPMHFISHTEHENRLAVSSGKMKRFCSGFWLSPGASCHSQDLRTHP